MILTSDLETTRSKIERKNSNLAARKTPSRAATNGHQNGDLTVKNACWGGNGAPAARKLRGMSLRVRDVAALVFISGSGFFGARQSSFQVIASFNLQAWL